jgi:C4-dicarboxylate-binding protein DctP
MIDMDCEIIDPERYLSENQGRAMVNLFATNRPFVTVFRRNIFRSILILSSALLLMSCGQSTDNKPIVIKFPHVTAPGTPKGQGAEKLRQLVAERLAGKVVVEVYPSSQLMNDDDSLEALAFGEVQMIAISLSKFDRLTRKFMVFDLPFLFRDLSEVEAFQDSQAGQDLMRVIAKKGFLGLAYWHNGMKQFGGPAPIRTPADGNGLKFRIMESDVLEAQILAMGGNPQKMAFGEVYQALQTGAIDAQENTWSNNYSQKFFEVQDYFTESNHGYLGYLLTVNPGFWNKLPEDIRLTLGQIIEEVTAEVNTNAELLNQQDREKILASGLTEIVKLEERDLEAWREVMKPVWSEFADEIGSDIMMATPAGKDQ